MEFIDSRMGGINYVCGCGGTHSHSIYDARVQNETCNNTNITS
jgi:hypothetical protein